jgi:hypothetical protein
MAVYQARVANEQKLAELETRLAKANAEVKQQIKSFADDSVAKYGVISGALDTIVQQPALQRGGLKALDESPTPVPEELGTLPVVLAD